MTKFKGSGSLVYSTLLGGTSNDFGQGIALAAGGEAYVGGYTGSTNFPTTGGSFQTSAPGGMTDGWVVKVNAGGTALGVATYLGGSSSDKVLALAVNRDGEVFATGSTESSNFPTAGGAFQTSLAGMGFGSDAFVVRLGASGASLGYSTYLGGGSGAEEGRGIAVDVNNYASVTGVTGSSNFPTTTGAMQTSNGGTMVFDDAFVTRLTPTGGSSFSSYLGGSGTDQGNGLALDAWGNVYVAGTSNSTNLPIQGAYQGSNAGGYDAFVSKVVPGPFAPIIQSITDDTGSSGTDQITSD